MDKVSLNEIKHIAIGNAFFAGLLFIIWTVLGRFNIRVVIFTLGGCVVSLAGFVWLCLSIQKLFREKPEKTKGVMTKSYIGRMLLYAGWAVFSIAFGKDPVVQFSGAVAVLFPSFTIKFMNVLIKQKNIEEEEK